MNFYLNEFLHINKPLLLFYCSVMSMISESASHSTLVSDVSNWNKQSDGSDIRTVDTPIPKERLSDETIHLLRKQDPNLQKTLPRLNLRGKRGRLVLHQMERATQWSLSPYI